MNLTATIFLDLLNAVSPAKSSDQMGFAVSSARPSANVIVRNKNVRPTSPAPADTVTINGYLYRLDLSTATPSAYQCSDSEGNALTARSCGDCESCSRDERGTCKQMLGCGSE